MSSSDEAIQSALAGIRRKIEAMKKEPSRWDDLALEDYQGIRNETIDEILEVLDRAGR